MWTIPAEKMKRTVQGKISGRPHFVPLANRSVEILKEIYSLTGHGRYVFPSLLTGERPMSENTIRTALRRMGYTNDDMTPHGFRAMARTVLVEPLGPAPSASRKSDRRGHRAACLSSSRRRGPVTQRCAGAKRVGGPREPIDCQKDALAFRLESKLKGPRRNGTMPGFVPGS